MEFRVFDKFITQSHLEGAQISGRWATSISLKWLLEKRARMCAITERVWHFYRIKVCFIKKSNRQNIFEVDEP